MNIATRLKTHILCKRSIIITLLVLALTGFGMATFTNTASASIQTPVAKGGFQCGSGNNKVGVSINIGCEGESCKTSNKDGCSALLDAVFAIVRFLSAGVGIVIVGSTIWAGVQYSSARDDPSAVGKAKDRLRGNGYALLMYVFAYAILNYILPGGFFK
jgi:hypothetical protein